jgi:hypothetical protein
MKRLFIALLASLILISCGDDDSQPEVGFFDAFEGQWLSTTSDKFGIERGEGTYYYKFENSIVTHYVNNGEFNGIIFTWNYRTTTDEGDNYMDLLNSGCWISDQGGKFGVLPTSDGTGFRLINTTTYSDHPFFPSEPDFPLDFDTNPCASRTNDWIDNYKGIVFKSERNDNSNQIVFDEGTAYTKTGKSTGYSKAFTYTSSADDQFEYFDILEICPDYKEDFEMFEGEHTVNQLNNVDGLRTSGFKITRGIAEVTYIYDNPNYPDVLQEDCYVSSVE